MFLIVALRVRKSFLMRVYFNYLRVILLFISLCVLVYYLFSCVLYHLENRISSVNVAHKREAVEKRCKQNHLRLLHRKISYIYTKNRIVSKTKVCEIFKPIVGIFQPGITDIWIHDGCKTNINNKV